VRLAAHWTATLLTAASAATLADIPFTGLYASAAGILAAAAVCAIGYATAPHPGART
jgi:hypothetical protein